MTKLGNTKMVHYGIQNETVDLRAHVGVNTKRVYIFTPQDGMSAINSGRYHRKPVYTGEILTAYGYAVPWNEIEGCHWFDIPEDVMLQAGFGQAKNTSDKGRSAEYIVKEMVMRGTIVMVLDTMDDKDAKSQMVGSDILVKFANGIQVKCDWRCGHKDRGGTGNLFLQTDECNPLKQR